jgi:hypothetical protein
MQLRFTRPLVALLLGAVLVLAAAGPARADGGLAALMHVLQTHAHKLQLSIAARNGELAYFYLHELEETAEEIVAEIGEYDGHPIGALTREMLLPAIESLEDSVQARDWPDSDARFAKLLKSCNGCHLVAGHGFIRIAPAEGNPFAQDFSPRTD